MFENTEVHVPVIEAPCCHLSSRVHVCCLHNTCRKVGCNVSPHAQAACSFAAIANSKCTLDQWKSSMCAGTMRPLRGSYNNWSHLCSCSMLNFMQVTGRGVSSSTWLASSGTILPLTCAVVQSRLHLQLLLHQGPMSRRRYTWR